MVDWVALVYCTVSSSDHAAAVLRRIYIPPSSIRTFGALFPPPTVPYHTLCPFARGISAPVIASCWQQWRRQLLLGLLAGALLLELVVEGVAEVGSGDVVAVPVFANSSAGRPQLHSPRAERIRRGRASFDLPEPVGHGEAGTCIRALVTGSPSSTNQSSQQLTSTPLRRSQIESSGQFTYPGQWKGPGPSVVAESIARGTPRLAHCKFAFPGRPITSRLVTPPPPLPPIDFPQCIRTPVMGLMAILLIESDAGRASSREGLSGRVDCRSKGASGTGGTEDGHDRMLLIALTRAVESRDVVFAVAAEHRHWQKKATHQRAPDGRAPTTPRRTIVRNSSGRLSASQLFAMSVRLAARRLALSGNCLRNKHVLPRSQWLTTASRTCRLLVPFTILPPRRLAHMRRPPRLPAELLPAPSQMVHQRLQGLGKVQLQGRLREPRRRLRPAHVRARRPQEAPAVPRAQHARHRRGQHLPGRD